jgi:lipid II:glycine glycyltransferase (peptidoglycan interpeptide bridge formation enzyme)
VSLAVATETRLADPATSLWHSIETREPRIQEKPIHYFHPLKDARWNGFVEGHRRASVFHTSAWLMALQRTYGYEPVAFTTSAPEEALENAVLFCRVESWLTGRRLVSLPFSDHCDPLVDQRDAAAMMARIAQQELSQNHWKYVEIRPLQPMAVPPPQCETTVPYAFHQLDLDRDLYTIFNSFHKNSIQRKIQRSEREGLGYREGTTPEFLEQFYRLFKVTRERHRVPPQPRKWFVNLIECLGSALKIRVAYKEDKAVAAMLTLRHKDTLIYKYGCSDARFNNLGSMHLLYWHAIQEAKSEGVRTFDLGRTDLGQQGLITFKNRWGARQSTLTYSRYSNSESSTHFFDVTTGNWKARTGQYVLSHLPSRVVAKIGELLYGHVG